MTTSLALVSPPAATSSASAAATVTATAAIQAALALNAVEQSDPRTARFTAYPNPALDVIRIDVSGPKADQVDWVLIDLQGRPVQRGTDWVPFLMELNGLSTGIHLLHLRQGQHTEVIQITHAH